jgi:predicted DNA-binding transcriptional regulator AlpA
MNSGESLPALLSEREVAKLLRVSVRTLRRWRLERAYGPPALRVGRFVRYLPRDVDAWINAQGGPWDRREPDT